MTATYINPTIKLSNQQTTVLEVVQDPTSGNLMLVAVAGSGKTFTLLEILKVLPYGEVAFAAFSSDIAKEIKVKVEQIVEQLRFMPKIGTCHSFGLAGIRKIHPATALLDGDNVPQKKIEILMERVVNRKTTERGVPYEFRSFVRKAYQLARQWGAGCEGSGFAFNDREAWMNLVDHFDLEGELYSGDKAPMNIDELVREAIVWTVYTIGLGIETAPVMIDFEDMIYLTIKLQVKVKPYDVVLVDEVQDLNWTRRTLISKMLKKNGRAIFVGDPRQAIYAFTGADHLSIENITREFKCRTLPLTWSFRCPKSVVRFAQTWVNHIESTPDAPEGTMATIDEAEFNSMNLSATDAILCRNNAPLVTLFFQFLSKGIAAHIEGKDIAKDLIKVINRFQTARSVGTLFTMIEDYRDTQVAEYNKKGKNDKAERLTDATNAVLAVIENMDAMDTVAELKSRITNMFEDSKGNKKQTLTLTTIHKSKGREWNRVFWWGRNAYNNSKHATKDWELIAEENLCYVAATRSKNELYDVLVSTPKAAIKPSRVAA